ncbi:MAG: P-II family nitrogen regulator [Gammaproteobacteria bacterium]
MKYIVAVIRPDKLEETINALAEADVTRLTVGDCRGVGGMEKTSEVYRGVRYTIHYRLKSRLEIAVNEAFVQPTIDTISRICSTGDPTDGVIFVLELHDFINIGSGKTGGEAI